MDTIQIYSLYEHTNDDTDHSVSREVEPYSPELAKGLEGQQNGRDQDSFCLGLRWDVYTGIAFKLQYTHVDDHKRNRNADIIRIGIDTVF